MRTEETRFPDVRLILDEDGGFAGILTPDGIEASTAEAAFLEGNRVLSSLDAASQSIRRILYSQLGITPPRGFCAELTPDDLAVFCSQECPVEAMNEYLARKGAEVSEKIAVWLRERPWDTCPMTLAEARSHNFVFDAETGAIGTDGRFNPDKTVEVPSSVDGRRVTKIVTGCLVSYHYIENIILPDSITEMEPYTFYYQVYIKSVNIPKGMRSIPEGAFSRCRSLMSVTIPENIEEIRAEAFYQCSRLDTVFVPDTVRSVGGRAFMNVPRIVYHGKAKGFPWGATVGN